MAEAAGKNREIPLGSKRVCSSKKLKFKALGYFTELLDTMVDSAQGRLNGLLTQRPGAGGRNPDNRRGSLVQHADTAAQFEELASDTTDDLVLDDHASHDATALPINSSLLEPTALKPQD